CPHDNPQHYRHRQHKSARDGRTRFVRDDRTAGPSIGPANRPDPRFAIRAAATAAVRATQFKSGPRADFAVPVAAPAADVQSDALPAAAVRPGLVIASKETAEALRPS